MTRRRLLPTRSSLAPALFAGWTLFVWGGRLRNLAQEPGPIGQAGRWSLIGAVAFCLLALATLAALVVTGMGRGARAGGAAAGAPERGGAGAGAPTAVAMAVATLGVLTVGVWVPRAVDIVIGDHSIGFVVVHVVLAVVSIGLAVVAWWSLRTGGDAAGVGGGPDAGRLPSRRWVNL